MSSGDPKRHLETPGGWQLWRIACLRGAGFPADLLLDLAAPDSARAADAVLTADEAVRSARANALHRIEHTIGAAEGETRAHWIKVLRDIKKGKTPESETELSTAVSTKSESTARYDAAFEAARRHLRDHLRTHASDPDFTRALLWQNRAAWHRTVKAFVDGIGGDDDGRTERRTEQLIASYLQRYCAKNDTIGFFGPVGWATLRDEGPAVHAIPGDTLIDRRNVYFEYWAIDAIAQLLAHDNGLRPHLAPRRLPTIRLDGETAYVPIDKRISLPDDVARLLADCDGSTSAAAIAARALARDDGETADDVLATLDELVDAKLIQWGLELPPADHYPERTLRALVERVPDEAERRRALASLDALDARRDAVVAAATPEALDGALAALETTFTELTQQRATRNEGQIYAGRTLLFEDCSRAMELHLGPAFLEKLGPALDLILQSARWYTHAIARDMRAALGRAFDGMNAVEVDFLRFRKELVAFFDDGTDSIFARVSSDLAARWQSLIPISNGDRRIRKSSRELAASVKELFAAPGPGWPSARYQSPDVLIAASGIDAIARGEFFLVLGELHPGMNAVAQPLFVKEHDSPDAISELLELDLPSSRIAPVWSKARSRGDLFSVARHDLELEAGTTRSARPPSQVIEAAQLVVARRDGQLIVRARDGRHSFDVIDFLDHHLVASSHARFSLFPAAPHTPRVTLDDLVIARERWSFEPDVLSFAGEKTPRDRFLAARLWARRHALPRFLFAKVPEEPKPQYVDMESPVYVELLAKSAKKASRLVVSEMLPSFDELWLPDAGGRRFTAELRIAAVDCVSFSYDLV